MKFVLILLVAILIQADERFVLVGNHNFPVDKLSKFQIKQIYLKKARFIDGVAITPINYQAQNLLRKRFEKSIFSMSQKRLKRYWLKEHYLGRRAPVVQKSIKSALLFVVRVDGAVAYVPYSQADVDVKILYEE